MMELGELVEFVPLQKCTKPQFWMVGDPPGDGVNHPGDGW